MNLHAIVAGAIGAVNPFVPATLQQSTGYTTNADGSRDPTYSTRAISCQVQALTYTDLTKLDGLNIQGTRRAIYVTGEAAGIIRVKQEGGDLVIFPDNTLPEGNTWLCAQVLEQWSDGAGVPAWVKICVTLQDGS